jgi:uncharacterized RDD family membrane protein YckC
VTGAPPDAPLARRFAALAYEATLYSAIVLLAGFLTIPLSSSAPSGAGGLRIPDLPARVLSFTLVFAAGALYYGWFWTAGRRTLPMKTWRLRITRGEGAPLGVRTALVRYMAGWIGPSLALLAYVALRSSGLAAHAAWLLALNYLWALVDPDRRFLHDRIAGTLIVDDRAPVGSDYHAPSSQRGFLASKRAMLSTISFFASSAPTHVETRTHLPGSRSL